MKNAIWIFVITVVILIGFLPSFSRMQDMEQRIGDYEVKIKELERKHVELLEEKRRLEEDPEYLEKVAREKMGIVREGEVLYKLMPMNRVDE